MNLECTTGFAPSDNGRCRWVQTCRASKHITFEDACFKIRNKLEVYAKVAVLVARGQSVDNRYSSNSRVLTQCVPITAL